MPLVLDDLGGLVGPVLTPVLGDHRFAAGAAVVDETHLEDVHQADEAGPIDPSALAARLREVTQRPDAAALRATLKQRAAARLARYTWEANARRLLEHLMHCGVVAPRADVDLAPPGLGSGTSFA